jgi:hypothetical protein
LVLAINHFLILLDDIMLRIYFDEIFTHFWI